MMMPNKTSSALVDGGKFKDARGSHPQKKFVEADVLTLSDIDRIENNRRNPAASEVKVAAYAKKLGKPLPYFLRNNHQPSPIEVSAIERGLSQAVAHALRRVRFAMNNAYAVSAWEALPKDKITDQDIADDPAEPVDQVTSDAIEKVLRSLAERPGHPLASGCLLVDEEKGFVVIVRGHSGEIRWIIFVDSADDSSLFKNELGGMILASAYYVGAGWQVAVACDVVGCRLYSRSNGSATKGLKLPFPNDEVEPRFRRKDDPIGRALTLSPSRKTTLKGSSVCMYLGKPQRILETASRCAVLLGKKGIREIIPRGGSQGPILVGDGRLDAAVEVVKGFKVIDSMPGLFLAAGMGATVLVPDGTAIDFGPEADLEAVLGLAPEARRDAFEKLRRRFVVAATPELAKEIIECL
jgi:hypothetical protein